MNTATLHRLRDQLNDRDIEILISLERFRLLSSRHIDQLHFEGHANPVAAARAGNRTLQRLKELGLVQPLERRIGGVRRGSASYIWQLAATGEHYLRAIHGIARRRRYVEPGLAFVSHTLAVNDVAVELLRADHTTPGFGLDELVTEPTNWRSYLGPAGEARWLKPDLYVLSTIADPDESANRTGDDSGAAASDGGLFEDHVFLEIDLGTEHRPRIQAKCRAYAAYAATGAYQAEHGLFPAVTWLSPDPTRRQMLRAAIASTYGLPRELFQVLSPSDYLRLATRGH
jgi:hypothetical protein